MSHVFIAIPESEPDSVIFGTRAPDTAEFKYINITCQDCHIKFEDYNSELPTFTWTADISGQDIENGPVDKFINNLKPAIYISEMSISHILQSPTYKQSNNNRNVAA